MINVPDKLHSTAVDNKVIDSVQAEYVDTVGRTELLGVDNVKDALDRIIDRLFPATHWEFGEVSYSPVIVESKNLANSSYYYGVSQTYSKDTVIGSVNFSLVPGNSDKYSISSLVLTRGNLEIPVNLSNNSTSGSVSVNIGFIDATDPLVYTYGDAEINKTVTDANLVLTLTNSETNDVLTVTSPNITIPFKVSKGQYTSWGDYGFSFNAAPTTSRIMGESVPIVLSWEVQSSISKEERNSAGQPITQVANIPVTMKVASGSPAPVASTGELTITITESTSFTLYATPEGAGDVKGLLPEPKNQKYTVNFSYESFYFWSKSGNLTSIPTGTTIYKFTSGGNYTPSDTTGWYFYIVSRGSNNVYMTKLIGSLDAYYAELSTKVGSNIQIPAGTWSISGKTQAVALTGYNLYRSVENIVHGQTIKLQ